MGPHNAELAHFPHPPRFCWIRLTSSGLKWRTVDITGSSDSRSSVSMNFTITFFRYLKQNAHDRRIRVTVC